MNTAEQPAPGLARRPPQDLGSRVPFRIQRVEHRLLWALAAYAVWLAIVRYAAEPTAWLLAAEMALAAFWCHRSPARHADQLLLRGVLLLAGAFFLELRAGAVVLDDVAFSVTLLVVAVYTLLLPGRVAFGWWALAAIEFLGVRLAVSGSFSWQASFSQAALLATACYLLHQYARGAAELDLLSESARRDRGSRLYNEEGFFAHGGELFDDCRRQKRPFAMVLLNSGDLRDVPQLAGKKVANQLFAQLVHQLERATPPGGLAARTDTVEFAMLFPGMNAVRAALVLKEALGQPPRVEVTLRGQHVTMILDSLVAEATAEVTSLEDFYDRLHAKLHAREGSESDAPSTLRGMLEPDGVVPHFDRPTMPTALAHE